MHVHVSAEHFGGWNSIEILKSQSAEAISKCFYFSLSFLMRDTIREKSLTEVEVDSVTGHVDLKSGHARLFHRTKEKCEF